MCILCIYTMHKIDSKKSFMGETINILTTMKMYQDMMF